jgi:iron complex outermembrane receptor protein
MKSRLYRVAAPLPFHCAATSALAIILAALAAPASAQIAENASSPAEGEIIVTAERREQNILKTPIAVTAVGSEEIRTGHIETIQDLSRRTAGISLANGSVGTAPIFIRGIGTVDHGVLSSVGVYVDDVYIPRSFGNALLDLPDIERIEVLRGPQGTLYGQNTSAGAVKIVSRKPSDTFTAMAYGEIGNRNAFRTQGYISGPLIPGLLSASFAISHRERDGFTRNLFTDQRVDTQNSEQFRAKLRFTPSADIEAIFSVDRAWDNSDNQRYIALNYGIQDPRITYGDANNALDRDIKGASFQLSINASDALTVKSITGYRDLFDHVNAADLDGTPDPRYAVLNRIRDKQFSQELQVLGETGPLTYTIGAIYLHETFDTSRFSTMNARYSVVDGALKLESGAIYGQLNYNITPALQLTGGLRYGKETQHFANISYQTDANFSPTTLLYSVDGLSHSWTKLTPRLAIDYQWSPLLMSYVSWTRGSKSGGYNRGAGTALTASIPVAPETVTTYEFGTKGRTSDNVIQARAAAFYNAFENYQASINNPLVNGQLINGTVIVNAAKAKTYGVELETTLAPVEGLQWSFAATWLRTRFTSFLNPTGAPASDFRGNELPVAPRWVLSSSVDYVFPLPVPGELSANASVNYRTSSFSDAANRPTVKLDAQTYVDIGLTYRTVNDRLTFQLLAKNLFDKAYIVGPNVFVPSINTQSAGYGPPRAVTFSVRYGL